MTVEFLTIKSTELANVVVVATKRTNPNRRRAILFCSGKEMGQQTNTKPRTWHDFWIWRHADKVVCRMEVRGLALHLQYRWYGSHWFLSDRTHVAASAKQLLHTRLADFASAASCTATSRRIRHP